MVSSSIQAAALDKPEHASTPDVRAMRMRRAGSGSSDSGTMPNERPRRTGRTRSEPRRQPFCRQVSLSVIKLSLRLLTTDEIYCRNSIPYTSVYGIVCTAAREGGRVNTGKVHRRLGSVLGALFANAGRRAFVDCSDTPSSAA